MSNPSRRRRGSVGGCSSLPSAPDVRIWSADDERWRRASLVAALATVGLLLVFFHHRFWWPPDEGVFAHVAESLLDGKVLNRDVLEDHPGAIHFVHAAALGAFGRDLVSLRYPLALVSLALAAMIFRMTLPGGALAAFACSVGAIALGLLQFLNPQTHWYCLAIAAGIALLSTARSAGRELALGVLLGMCLQFRQLTAVFVAGAVLIWCLEGDENRARGADGLVARLVLGISSLGFAAYVGLQRPGLGLLLLGLWPPLLLAVAALRGGCPNRRTFAVLGRLSLGGLASLLPLMSYHAATRSVGAWIDDTLFSALSVARLDYLDDVTFLDWLWPAAVHLVSATEPAARLNGLFWILCLSAAPVLGAVATWRSWRGERLPALTLTAVFYGLVSLFNQIPLYLAYSLPLTCAALVVSLRHRVHRRLASAVLLGMSAIAIWYQAAQPASRGLEGIVGGQRVPWLPSGIERASLWIDDGSRTTYGALLREIARRSAAGESIFALPNDAELYFLANRRNPMPFHNTAIDVHGDEAARRVAAALAQEPPRLVIDAPRDKYQTPESRAILSAIRPLYSAPLRIGSFDLYVRLVDGEP